MVASILNGLSLGALLFVLASGFTLALGLTRVVNIAHGAFYVLGVHLAMTVVDQTGSYLLGFAVAALTVMALAAVVQRAFLRRFYLSPLPQVLFTMGLTLVLVEIARHIWGSRPRTMAAPELLAGSVEVLGTTFPRYRLFLIVAALVLALLLWLFMERSRTGILVRASIDDEEMARTVGIDVERLFTRVFALVGLLAGMGGVLGAPFLGFYGNAHFEMLTYTLVVVVFGGVGSLGGALLGSMIVGLIDSVGTVWFPELAYFLLFGPMVIMLAIRPTGLFGREF